MKFGRQAGTGDGHSGPASGSRLVLGVGVAYGNATDSEFAVLGEETDPKGERPGMWQLVHSLPWMPPEWPGAVSTRRCGAWQLVQLPQPSRGWPMTGIVRRLIVPASVT